MNKYRNREMMREILDIVLNSDSTLAPPAEGEENLTVFYEYSAHVGILHVRVFPGKWEMGRARTEFDFDVRHDIPREEVDKLRNFVMGLKGVTA